MVQTRYQSRSRERHVRAPREHTWRVLLETIEQGAGGYLVEGDPAPHGAGAVTHFALDDGDPLVETVLSFEPPWRRAYSVEGPGTGLDLYHGTFVLRDDGPECHLSWGVVFDPEPSPEAAAFLEVAVSMIERFLEKVATGAEASS